MEIGPVDMFGGERAPLSWQSIRAWEASMQKKLRPWEARLLRRLSGDYLAESRAAEDEHRTAPWEPMVRTQHDYDAEERRLRDLLG